MEAMLFFNLEKGIILTYNQEDEFHVAEKYVEVKPIQEWLYFSTFIAFISDISCQVGDREIMILNQKVFSMVYNNYVW